MFIVKYQVAETLIMNRGKLLQLLEFTTLSIFTCVHTITMAPYSRWVHPSFRQTLMDACMNSFKVLTVVTTKHNLSLLPEWQKTSLTLQRRRTRLCQTTWRRLYLCFYFSHN